MGGWCGRRWPSRRASHASGVARLLAGLGIALIASACTGGDASPADGPSQASELSPLEQVLGFSSHPSEERRLLSAQLVEVDASVTACMAQAGFDHQPAAGRAASSIEPASDGTRTWALEHGFGVVASARAVLDGLGPAAIDVPADLGPEEAERWRTALFGDTAGAVAYEPAGCIGNAYADSHLIDVWDDWSEDLASLNARFDADPRVVALTADWSKCMSEVGLVHDSPAEAADSFYVELLRVGALDQTAIGPGDRTALDDRIAALLDRERMVAAASWDCEEPHRKELRRIRDGYETEFVDDRGLRG